MDIKDTFQNILEDGLSEDLPFFESDSAPNPLLSIRGLGQVDIPLDEDAAKAVLSANVQFNNPAWQEWLGDSEYIFEKLVLTNSDSYEQSCTEPLSTLTIILPSNFTGGHVEFHDHGRTSRVDIPAQTTSVIALYPGVQQTVFPISSGYLLALVYRSSTPPPETPTQRLRRCFAAWEAVPEPPFLAILLQNKYTALNITGDDALLLSLLRPLAEERGFSLHWAFIEITSHYPEYPSFSYDETFMQSEISSFFEDSGSSDLDVAITRVVDINGVAVRNHTLSLKSGDLIPWQSDDVLREPDIQLENYAVFNRTALVISHPSDNLFGGDSNESARIILRGRESATPRDKHLASQLLQWCSTTDSPHHDVVADTVRLLRECAERWQDVDLLNNLIQVCGIGLVGPAGFVSAYKSFGWHTVEDLFTKVVDAEPCPIRRWALLGYLMNGAIETDVQVWCRQSKPQVQNQIDQEQVKWMVQMSVVEGGKMLEDILHPQLIPEGLPVTEFWVPYLRGLHEHEESIGPVGPIIAAVVPQVSSFPTRIVNGTDLQPIIAFILLCIEVGRSDLCTKIAEKIRLRMRIQPAYYYFALASCLGKFKSEKLVSSLKPFFVDAVRILLSPSYAPLDGQLAFVQWTTPVSEAVMNAAKRAGGAAILNQLISTNQDVLRRDTDTLQRMARSIVATMSMPDDPEYETLKNRVVTAAVDAFRHQGRTIAELEALVDFCLEVEAPATTLEVFLSRVAASPGGADVLIFFASRNDMGMERFAATVFESWAEYNRTELEESAEATTSQTIQRLWDFGCSEVGCQVCPDLRNFIRTSVVPEVRFQQRAQVRKHIEQQLEAWGAGSVGLTWRTISHGSPHSLEIMKPKDTSQVLWDEYFATGRRLLEVLGLGEDYSWM
ncbi:hypothetical protein FB45DRAFT_1065661 [Roridomyces roridus]|uniref:Uncharacterized protein n=1 Tax=Roridomyces roridus TaxID=1738132 RepID=A0AAD7B5X6_9AGAR|nr:hypothetical protein FB45DRAFT_1065661 [Roridomyces roridus]